MSSTVPVREKAFVREYMTSAVETVSPDDTVEQAASKMRGTDAHSGFPVCRDNHVIGYVSARDLLLSGDEESIEAAMSTDLVVARPDMKVKNAARVILRSGIQKLPVVEEDGRLVGIISHADVVRSQIERTSPRKVQKLKGMLEMVHGVDVDTERETITIDGMLPTQTEVYADELEGRKYELENGLHEPLVVIEHGDRTVLADGHHRALAARDLDISEMEAYILRLAKPVELGMAETARKSGLNSLDDVQIIDYAHHPLIEKIDRDETDEGE